MEEMPFESAPVQRLVTHSGDISVTGKSHKEKPDGSSKDDTEMIKVSRFKYATSDIRRLGEKY
jgi:hypothetical protein